MLGWGGEVIIRSGVRLRDSGFRASPAPIPLGKMKGVGYKTCKAFSSSDHLEVQSPCNKYVLNAEMDE